MNKKLEKIILGGFLAITMGGLYTSIDKDLKMTKVNTDNEKNLYFKTTEKTQITNETYTATNTNYKN